MLAFILFSFTDMYKRTGMYPSACVSTKHFRRGDTGWPVLLHWTNSSQDLRNLPGNSHCADCTCQRPEWAAVNHGVSWMGFMAKLARIPLIRPACVKVWAAAAAAAASLFSMFSLCFFFMIFLFFFFLLFLFFFFFLLLLFFFAFVIFFFFLLSRCFFCCTSFLWFSSAAASVGGGSSGGDRCWWPS